MSNAKIASIEPRIQTARQQKFIQAARLLHALAALEQKNAEARQLAVEIERLEAHIDRQVALAAELGS